MNQILLALLAPELDDKLDDRLLRYSGYIPIQFV